MLREKDRQREIQRECRCAVCTRVGVMPMHRVHPCGRHANAPCAPVWARPTGCAARRWLSLSRPVAGVSGLLVGAARAHTL